MSSILQCTALSKRYSNGRMALDNVSFSCESGRIVGLLGPNGSGKTTLIKLIENLLVPTQGIVTADGIAVGTETKKIISYLPDCDFFGDWMTAQDALSYYQDFFGDFDMERAVQMMSSLNITASDRLKLMSKGTREKLQLILTMSRRAKIYLLDEPIGGVDPATRDFILHTILSNFDENAAILISTHLISDIENILDDAIFISDGHIVLQSSVDEIRSQHQMSVNDYFREVFKCY